MIRVEAQPGESFESLFRRFKRIIERCLEKRPEDRYGSVAELRKEVEELLSEVIITGSSGCLTIS